MTQQSRRRRGVILTPQGKQKLLGTIREFESDHNFGEKYTIEELSGQTGLDPGTVAKVLDAEEGVDRRTLDRFFQTFNLELAETDYRRPLSTQVEVGEEEIIETSQNPEPIVQNRVDWGEAVDVSIFYGRTEELATLKQWIVDDRCRLVALLGMGGIGKTSLAARLGEQIQGEFEYVVWRSLKDAPPLKDILTNLIQFVSDQQETEADLPEAVNARITRLLKYLRHHRCLLVLDNAESILQEGQAGVYREGYEGYGELLKRVGEATHQSCLLLTSREKPKELVALEGASLPVRCWQMRGIEDVDGQKILRIKGLELSGVENQSKKLVQRCAGNPLALKLVATTIQELFDGDIAEFLREETIAFDGIRSLLDQHFDRLPNLEKSIMYWLSINREPVTAEELLNDIVPPVPRPRLLEALKGLVDRYLIETAGKNYTQQPVIMEYTTAQLIAHFLEELQTEQFDLFNHHALIKATAKDYIRETQIRLILEPVAYNLIHAERQLTRFLSVLQAQSNPFSGYVAGNILNLLCQMNISLNGYDFSDLPIRQAYLQGQTLHNANFAHAQMTRTVFSDSMGTTWASVFSPDGTLLAIGDSGGSIRFMRPTDGDQIQRLQGHTGWVFSLAFSPDGQILGSASYDSTVRLWDVRTGRCLSVLQDRDTQHLQSAVAFSPDGKTVAGGSSSAVISLWDVATGECYQTLQHSTWIQAVAFSPDGQTFAGGGYDHTVRIWQIRTGQLLATFQGHYGGVMTVRFSPDGRLLATGGRDRLIKLWDTDTYQVLKVLEGHNDAVTSVAFNSEGTVLATTSADCTAKIWDVQTSICLQTLRGHQGWAYSASFSPDGGTLVTSGSYDNTVKLWDLNNNRCLKTWKGYNDTINAVKFSPDSKTLASGSNDNTVRLWNVETGVLLKTFQGHHSVVTGLAFSADGQLLISGSADCTIRCWNIATGQNSHTLHGHESWIGSIHLSPDGITLASSSSDFTVRVWNIHSGQCLKVLTGHTGYVTLAVFSPNGQVLASCGGDHTMRLWNVDSGQCFKKLTVEHNWVRSATFSPDGQILVILGDSDAAIQFWDIQRGECFRILNKPGDGIQQGQYSRRQYSSAAEQICFSPDGKTLASVDDCSVVSLWDVTTGKCLRRFEGHTDSVFAVALSSDGQILASGSEDETIKLWNVQTGRCLRTLRKLKPYEGMNITGVLGLTENQKASLIALGAIDEGA